jgi:hypothetical protein
MPDLSFTRENMTKAVELAASASPRRATTAELELFAFIVGAVRRSHVPGTVTVGELLIAHDLLYIGAVRGTTTGLRESLAAALLARGHVPAPHEYAGNWWLWWPTQGRGTCQHCGQDRLVRRYSDLWGKPYRYLCEHCHGQEVAEETSSSGSRYQLN